MSEFGDPDYQMFLQSLVNDGDDFLFADEEEDGAAADADLMGEHRCLFLRQQPRVLRVPDAYICH